MRATSMAWETPFPQSRMPASIENFNKANCLSVFSYAVIKPALFRQPDQNLSRHACAQPDSGEIGADSGSAS